MPLGISNPIGESHLRTLRHTVIGTAGFTLLLGLVTLALAFGPGKEHVTLPGEFVYLKVNTSLAFVGCGAGLFAALARWRRISFAFGLIVLFLSGTTLLEYVTGMNFGIDEFLTKDFHEPNNPFPGRMAPNTAMAFAWAGLAIIWTYSDRWLRSWRTAGADFLGFLVFSLGADGMLEHLAQIHTTLSWGGHIRMAIPTAAGFMAVGAALLAAMRLRQGVMIARVSLWIPAILCFVAFIADISTPRGVAAGIAYIPLVFCSLWFNRPHSPIVFAAGGTALTVIAFFAKAPSDMDLWMVVMNCALTIGALWLMATVMYLRRKTEMALRESQSKLSAIVDYAPDGLVSIDARGIITQFNPACEQMFGYPAAEVMGQNIKILMAEPHRSDHDARIRSHIKTGEARIIGKGSREVEARRKDGSIFSADLGVNKFGSGAEISFVGVIRDMTRRKQYEEEILKFNETLEQQVGERTAQLAAVNKELEEFAYAASHDLKAPLRVIANASKWLEEDLAEHLTDENRANMNLLRGRTGRMAKLLDDLLEYSRIGRNIDGRFSEIIAGDELIENILALLSPPPGFTVIVSPSFSDIQVSRMPLQQILMNLIGNAIKHHDKQQGRIEVRVKDMGDLYDFAVKDDGPGIPAQFHDQVFKMFQTLKPRDQVEGSGMGLAMVRKNIETFGGTIKLSSSEGAGSFFQFTWPKQQQELGKVA